MVGMGGGGRIEKRVVDGAANPYLASAAMLAAGLDGIERRIDPGAANSGNLYEMAEEELRRRGIQYLPTTLQEALQCMQDDAVGRAALAEEYAAYYIPGKQAGGDRY